MALIKPSGSSEASARWESDRALYSLRNGYEGRPYFSAVIGVWAVPNGRR